MPEENKTKAQPDRNFLKRFRSVLLIPIVCVFIGLCYLYGRLIEVDWIKIKYINTPIRGLPEEFEGFKIVHLSDLHVTKLGRREKKLPMMVNSIDADAIVITGDFTHTREGETFVTRDGEAIAAAIVSQLKAKYGKWGVDGNWDSTQTIKACEEAGMKMLLTKADVIEVGGKKLGIIGLRQGVAYRAVSIETQRNIISRLKSQFPDGTPVIILSHMPRIIHSAQEENVDLVLSGHTHGGQVRIPFGPAIETPSDMGIWYSKGLFKFKNTYLSINPGIGLEPGPDYIQVRFWCRPEITVIVLRQAD